MVRSSQDTDLGGARVVWEKVMLSQSHQVSARNLPLWSLGTDSMVTKWYFCFPLGFVSFYRSTLGNLWGEGRGRNDWQI